MNTDPLIRYLEEQMKLAEKDSEVLAQAMSTQLQLAENCKINAERMRGALDKYHKDYAGMKTARDARLAELPKPPAKADQE